MHVVPVEHPIDLHHNLKNIAMAESQDVLYDKLADYQASLLRKCTKLYKETALVANDLLVENIKERAKNADIREFDEIFTRDFKGH